MDTREDRITSQFEELAHTYAQGKEKNDYYYRTLLVTCAGMINRTDLPILEIGCATGGILAAVSEVAGTGIDASPEMVRIAQSNHPKHTFSCQRLGSIQLEETFETILIPDVLEYIEDLDAAFKNIRSLSKRSARVVVMTPNPMWKGILSLSAKLGRKMKDEFSRPPSKNVVIAAARNGGFELVHSSTRLLIPKNVSLSHWVNQAYQSVVWLRSRGVIMVLTFSPTPESS